MSQPGPQNVAPGTWRAIVSIVETVGYAVALIAAAVHDFHLGNPWTIGPLLTAFLAHGINHPAGGSPV